MTEIAATMMAGVIYPMSLPSGTLPKGWDMGVKEIFMRRDVPFIRNDPVAFDDIEYPETF